MKKLFLIIGAPGSGKTTDASIIAQNNSQTIAHFSTGELLRDEVETKSELGKTIDSYISKGDLVPLDIVVNTIISAIKKSQKDVILIDGYPRSVEQMRTLDEILKKEDMIKLVSVIEVNVSEKVARERVLGRNRGTDDNENVFNNRMRVYSEPLGAIQSFYTSKRLLQAINGERDIQSIVSDMEAFIKTRI
ncbi:MAG: adenylate kinase [Campylobacteraceae bacterium]|jgi:adenylate kinase|nr:adenylate kinase [Campylobacteraceae bacterium]